MPIIFASALVSIPGTIASFVNVTSPFWISFLSVFNYNSLLYAVIYALLIIVFNYFYVSIQYNPVEIANNLRKNNGVIPGFRPGLRSLSEKAYEPESLLCCWLSVTLFQEGVDKSP